MEGKPLTKQDLMELLNEIVMPFIMEIDELKKELAKRPDRDEIKAIINRELAKYPTVDEVRRIVREEMESAFDTETLNYSELNKIPRYSLN
jgi:hypothetical protein